ncbi:DEAD/DEAH box helicase [Streptomyces telluris]|uniref:DEAD/DEAH box helicase n=1 Tax=Streptomyces telluris TaxID=2720021 RepID=A0A9X2LP81_9ACTN|nr:DEAD/DEAH box helicase [Streptomyces telluris]MCQ8774828.1 DEAD/DEAH box helicase [Streptomyces telluris]NJP76703.1 DEAD/DEAH box helicase [Streptomyces telluris]
MTRSARPARPRGPQQNRGAQQNRSSQQGGRSGAPSSRRRPAAPQGDFETPVSTTPALPPVASFADLDMPAGLLSTLTREGVTEPFPIQAATLPNSLTGRDVLGRGRTGSGKTLAFGLAMLARTAGRRAEPGRPLALVLVPTRELAQQVTDSLAPYATAVNLRTATVVGGMSIGRQAQTLARGAEVLVATPGRLADLIQRGDCKLGDVRITVLDEADQMADMGFLPQVTKLLDQVDPEGQRMLFSATLDRNVDRLVRRFLSDPVTHSVDASVGAVVTMDHHLLHVSETDKKDTVTRIAARDGRVIMFVDTKRGADRLVKKLLSEGVRAAALHGGKSQPQRNRTLDLFRTQEVTALIATNVAARGIHIDGLDLVVNVDPPMDHKDYLHRGGRTARAGESGTVVTLVLPEQRREMSRMMVTAKISPNVVTVGPEDEELVRITGAQQPSGVPVVIAPPVPAQSTPRKRSGGGGASAGSAGGAAAAAGSRGSRGTRGSRGGRGGRGRVRTEMSSGAPSSSSSSSSSASSSSSGSYGAGGSGRGAGGRGAGRASGGASGAASGRGAGRNGAGRGAGGARERRSS